MEPQSSHVTCTHCHQVDPPSWFKNRRGEVLCARCISSSADLQRQFTNRPSHEEMFKGSGIFRLSSETLTSAAWDAAMAMTKREHSDHPRAFNPAPPPGHSKTRTSSHAPVTAVTVSSRVSMASTTSTTLARSSFELNSHLRKEAESVAHEFTLPDVQEGPETEVATEDVATEPTMTILESCDEVTVMEESVSSSVEEIPEQPDAIGENADMVPQEEFVDQEKSMSEVPDDSETESEEDDESGVQPSPPRTRMSTRLLGKGCPDPRTPLFAAMPPKDSNKKKLTSQTSKPDFQSSRYYRQERKKAKGMCEEAFPRSEDIKVPKGKGRRHIFKQRGTSRRAPVATATVVTGDSLFYKGFYWQKGDVVSLIDSEDGKTYYATIKGLLSDQYCEKSALVTWLLPTKRATPGKFDPSHYVIGPEDEVPRSLDVMEIVCRTPSDYFYKANAPYPFQEPSRDLCYVWSDLHKRQVLRRVEEVAENEAKNGDVD